MPFQATAATAIVKARLVWLLRQLARPFLALWWALWYRIESWRLNFDEAYVRAAFSELAQVDTGEFMRVPGTAIWFKGWGNEVHVLELTEPVEVLAHTQAGSPNRKYEFVMKEGLGRRIYVDEWREATRTVMLEYGAKHVTNWWEVYRSGRWIRSTKFIPYLKLLYGENNAKRKNGPQVHQETGRDKGAVPAV